MDFSSSFVVFQIDLIDFRKTPDKGFNWIGHVIDHFSKFHIIFPLIRKEAEEVVENLVCKVFCYVGLPFLLHSDRGREFVNDVIRNTVKKWPGKCKMINGKARSPWVQGCVEKGNQSVELMISAKRQDTKRNH